VIVIRLEVYTANRWIAQSLYKAFVESQRRSYDDLDETVVLKSMLPWLNSNVDEARAEMGDDFWPYGVEPTRNTLTTLLRYSREQGLSQSLIEPQALFAPETLEAFKI
jgi:4,5-dihydroxyphthalate decarboxylase